MSENNYLNKKKNRPDEVKSQNSVEFSGNDISSENQNTEEIKEIDFSDLITKDANATIVNDQNELENEFHLQMNNNGNLNIIWKIVFPKKFKFQDFKEHQNLDEEIGIGISLSSIEEEERRILCVEISKLNNSKETEEITENYTAKTFKENIFNEFFQISNNVDITSNLKRTVKEKSNGSRLSEDKYQEKFEIPKDDDSCIIAIFRITLITRMIRNTNISKKFGYVGLVNEGMTCYMNCLIQTLNTFNYFKKAVYQIPIKEDDENSVTLSLQRLFYDLMKDELPASTGKLIQSFGWGQEQIQVQHDVQEFNLILSDVMETNMKGTPVEGTFSTLFEGKIINYLHCVDVDFKRNIEEKFCDLQLTVKDCKDIYESFDKYTEEEILDGNDKYEAEGFGKQKAKKGIKFSHFPSILMLQLKRFEYNPYNDRMMKINDHFEFYPEIDLSKYLIDEDKRDNPQFTLHSIIIHKGNINSGHYYCFIRPTLEDSWLKFNDELVRPANKLEVFSNNYGGEIAYYDIKDLNVIKNRIINDASAYVLIYIKNDSREYILSPFDIENHVPRELKLRFESERKEEKRILNNKQRKFKNIDIALISKETLKGLQNFGIIKNFHCNDNGIEFRDDYHQRLILSFPKSCQIEDLYQFISERTKIKDLQLYLVTLSSPENIIKRFHFNLKLMKNQESKKISELINSNTNIPLIFLVFSESKKVFEHGKIEVEEYLFEDPDNKKEKTIFVPSDRNILNFHENSNDEMLVDDKPKNIELEEDSTGSSNKFTLLQENKNKIIFLKRFDVIIEGNNKDIILSLDKVVNYRENLIEEILQEAKIKYSKIFDQYVSIETSIYQEFSSKKLELEKFSIFQEIPDYKTGFLNDKESIILVVDAEIKFADDSVISLKNDFIRMKGNDYFYKINLDTVFVSKHTNIEPEKFEFNLTNNENEIKEIIFDRIVKNDQLEKYLQTNIKYFNQMKEELTFETIKNQFSVNNIELVYEKSLDAKIINKPIQLTNFISKDNSIRFKILIFPNQKRITKKKSYLLFDINNNFIAKISVEIPIHLKKTNEIVSFLYPILMKFYPNTYVKEDFYFILQNPNKVMMYDIFMTNTDLYKWKEKAKINYRIQPFSKEEQKCFSDSKKHFVMFLTKDDYFIMYPIVIFIESTEKFETFKNLVFEKVRMIEEFKNLELSLKKLKFFTMEPVNDYFPVKNEIIPNCRCQDSMKEIIKSNTLNILVEIPINFENNQLKIR